MINQHRFLQFVSDYSKTHREDFNQEILKRSEYDIIEEVEKVILAAIKNDSFGRIQMQVNYFNIIEDYRQVKEILYFLESKEKRKNKRIDINIHDYINIKDSDVILLEVNYTITVYGHAKTDSVYIDIPKVVDKYYFRIGGTIYNSLYQIADASTYNNSSSKKDRSVSFRQEFLKSSIYEKSGKITQLVDNTEQTVFCYNYIVELFGKYLSVCKFFLAKYGLYGAMGYLFLNFIDITYREIYNPLGDRVVFKKGDIYISTPYELWNSNKVLQSFIFTVFQSIPKNPTLTDYQNLFTRDFWLTVLGAEYKPNTVEKGLSILDSTERNYSIDMQQNLRVREDDKSSLIDILRWIMCQFDDLYAKDNYDMNYKKLRFGNYIAGFYAEKLTKQINRIDKLSQKQISAEKIFNLIDIKHDYILDCLKKTKLLSFKNMVNDDDCVNALKYTFKGESGIGENKASAIPTKYRLANPSQLGKIDCDASPAGDPGMTGIICPYTDIHTGGYFTEYQEPDNWRDVHNKELSKYREENCLDSDNLFKMIK